MANWDNLQSRGNVEDRRGFGPTAIGGGLGITGILVLLALNFLGGGDVGDVITQLENTQVTANQNYDAKDFEGSDSYEVFTSTVLGSNNDMWTKVFIASDNTYTPPKLVLFRSSTDSACGGASSQVGPHYCPLDKTIYLDETFFDELKARFDTEGGDVAEAYVISHEVGHHIQNLMGLIQTDTTNEDSVQTELQADCFAGLWAYSIRDLGVFEPGEIKEALDAAAAVGDDRIQKAITGRINPETWTHGSSEQRVSAFNKGFETGLISSCDAV